MQDIDLEYLNEYKFVEKICNDMYGDRGISAYIEIMENTTNSEKFFIHNWDNYYKMLKHLRWLRNQVAHETSSYEVTNQDIKNIKQIHNDLLTVQDPLALLYRRNHDMKKEHNIDIKVQAHSTNSNHASDVNYHKKSKFESIIKIILTTTLFIILFILIYYILSNTLK